MGYRSFFRWGLGRVGGGFGTSLSFWLGEMDGGGGSVVGLDVCPGGVF